MKIQLIILSLITYSNFISSLHHSNAPTEELYHARIEDITNKKDAEDWYEKNFGKKVKIIESKGVLGGDSGGEDLIIEVK